MKTIATLYMYPSNRKYNDIVRKSLLQAGIGYVEESGKHSKYLMVSAKDEHKAAIIVLAIPFKNASYNDITKYISNIF